MKPASVVPVLLLLSLGALPACAGSGGTAPSPTSVTTSTDARTAPSASAPGSATGTAGSSASGSASSGGPATTASASGSAGARSSAPPVTALPSLRSYGGSSTQCASMSALLMGATRISALAGAGQVTADDVNQVYGNTAAIPPEALPLVEDARSVSLSVVGKDASAAAGSLGDFQRILDNLTRATQTVCS